jgi:hypothetical protein
MALRSMPQRDETTIVSDDYKSLNNLSGLEYRLMRFSATGWLIASAGEQALGVLANGGTGSAQTVSVHMGGRSELKMDDTCSLGDRITPNDSGYGVVTATDNASGICIALANCSAAGQIIPVIVYGGTRQ